MPHIVLEYSANLPELSDFRALFTEVHQVLHRTGGIKIENCKSRVREAGHYHVGDGHADNAFVHLDVEFVKGRSAEVRQSIGRECLEVLKKYYQAQLSDRLQLTVKIDDIALDFYFKEPAGTLNYQ